VTLAWLTDTGRLNLATGVYSGTYLWYGYGRTSPGEFKFTLTNPKAAAGADTEEEVKAATPEDHDHGPEDTTDAAAGEGGKAADGDDVADAEPEPRTSASIGGAVVQCCAVTEASVASRLWCVCASLRLFAQLPLRSKTS